MRYGVRMSRIPYRIIILSFSLLMLAGCGELGEEPLPEPLNGTWEWGQVAFSGAVADLYADQPYPQVTCTRIYLYFPGRAPGDPAVSRIDIALRLDNALEPLPIPPLPDSSVVLGAPVASPLTYIRGNYLYSGLIAPYVPGEWSLEFVWRGPDVDSRAYLPLTIETSETRRMVTPMGSFENFTVLAWLLPPRPVPGPQEVELLAWRSLTNTQQFLVDQGLTLILTFPEAGLPGGVPDSSVAVWDGTSYVGTLTFPDLESWDVRVTAMRDDQPVGSGVFLLD